ncbi:formylglycine-generating enzyme family protein [Paraburkholderia pallida]|uniref:Sulfatase modifying factor 1 n=1 Tax=Paraburkholderia pallida TaxID=2547399 RepID=A0A4P7CZE2_9BURK|nr:SUMF1/EgtB/PvdO family nonheme iron enzyme [Paraburkholderia pallida]QBR01706.1 sulfatase modifying factor 1 [Paraburkholderia pallida]
MGAEARVKRGEPNKTKECGARLFPPGREEADRAKLWRYLWEKREIRHRTLIMFQLFGTWNREFMARLSTSRRFTAMTSAAIWLTFCLPACSQQNSQTPDVKALVKKSLADMVFVKGGTFMMGDFGPSATPEKLPYTAQHENKPAHQITLDSFSIGRYKVTYADFDVYTKATGKPSWPQDAIDITYKRPDYPVGVPWQMAKDYCQWLGQQSGLPIDLPTEAQWEYAARSGGKPLIFATDNGKWEPDRNFPSGDTVANKLAPDFGYGGVSMGTYPIGKYPPNPLGLYDMGFDGRDWVNDWFAPDYYDHSPEKNPQGPATGTEKVIRGEEGGSDETAMTIYRYKKKPAPYALKTLIAGKPVMATFVTDTFRCAVQNTSKVPQGN